MLQILQKRWEYNKALYQLFLDIKKAYDSATREALYNILTKFGTPMKLVRLITMSLNEIYTRVWVRNQVSDMFLLGSRFATVRFTTIHIYDSCRVGPNTPDL